MSAAGGRHRRAPTSWPREGSGTHASTRCGSLSGELQAFITPQSAHDPQAAYQGQANDTANTLTHPHAHAHHVPFVSLHLSPSLSRQLLRERHILASELPALEESGEVEGTDKGELPIGAVLVGLMMPEGRPELRRVWVVGMLTLRSIQVRREGRSGGNSGCIDLLFRVLRVSVCVGVGVF